jgi:iron uptake system EfeUOB component EfeO/EfeM
MPFGYSGNGGIFSVKEISTGADGVRDLEVKDTVLSPTEIRILNDARSFVIQKHGIKAKEWPIMVNTISKNATYFNQDTQNYILLNNNELEKLK